VARLFGTLEGAKSTASRTGEDRLTARLATWHGAVVVTLDDHGTWTVHTEPADPQQAGAAVPAVVARGNVHTGDIAATMRRTVELGRRASRSPARRPGPGWTPYTEAE
jgi:hypothetical protein